MIRTPAPPTDARVTDSAFVLASIAALACVGYIATYYVGLGGQSDREVTASSAATGFNVVIALALVGLAVTLPLALPAMARLPVLLAASAMALTGATMLAFGTLGAIFASSVTDAVWDAAPDDHVVTFLLLFLPKMLTGLVGFGALAVIGRRRRTITTAHAVLLAVAGLALAAPPPPPGALLASLAVLWSIRTTRVGLQSSGDSPTSGSTPASHFSWHRPIKFGAMTARMINTIDDFEGLVGEHLGYSDYVEISQDQINTFAQVTGDHQWIHVDVERAQAGPFGGTIAHGYLTLSLGPMLAPQIFDTSAIPMGLNYGCNKVRFPAPVPVGSRVRLGVTVLHVEDVEGGIQITMNYQFEVEGAPKPSCVAEVIVRYFR